MSDAQIPGDAPSPDGGRRNVLAWLGRGFLSLWAVGFAYVAGAFVRAPHSPESLADRVVKVGPVADLPVGQGTLVQHGSTPIWVFRTGEDQFVGLDAVCTHMRCVLQWDEKQKMLRCPCHEASFDLNGNVLSGPASQGVGRHAVETQLGQIYVRV